MIEQLEKIVVLTGGDSPERDVSIATSKSLVSALDELGLEHEVIYAEGDFIEQLKEFSSCIFLIAMHGGKGENGTIQGLLDAMDITYSGSGVFSSALCMNKQFTKEILEYHGILTPKWQIISSPEEINFEIPFVIKPASGGSTIATSIVKKKFEIDSAFELAKEECQKTEDAILVEEYIPGKELTVGVLDNKAFPVLEIESLTEFYDYRSKYQPGLSKHYPAENISEEECSRIQRIAEDVYLLLKCSGAVRVDFRYDSDRAYVLEVNTIPGMTTTSLLPEAAELAGIGFNDLVLKIINSAKEKKQK